MMKFIKIIDKYYPYRAFGGQNKIVYSTRFVTRRTMILLLPGLGDNCRQYYVPYDILCLTLE